MKRMSRHTPTETDEATTGTNVPLDLPDGDGDGDGETDGEADSDAGEPGKHRLRWKAQIEIDNIPSSIV